MAQKKHRQTHSKKTELKYSFVLLRIYKSNNKSSLQFRMS